MAKIERDIEIEAKAKASIRVENPKTILEWAAYVGERVLVKTKDAHEGKIAAKLVAIRNGMGEVLLAGHQRTELTPLSTMKRWIKAEAEGKRIQELRQAPEMKVTPTAVVEVPRPKEAQRVPCTSPGKAARNAEKSIAAGLVAMRDQVTGKYYVGGIPGFPFVNSLHGFVGTIAEARITSPGSHIQSLVRLNKNGIACRHEYLTVEEAALIFDERHPRMDEILAEEAKAKAPELAPATIVVPAPEPVAIAIADSAPTGTVAVAIIQPETPAMVRPPEVDVAAINRKAMVSAAHAALVSATEEESAAYEMYLIAKAKTRAKVMLLRLAREGECRA